MTKSTGNSMHEEVVPLTTAMRAAILAALLLGLALRLWGLSQPPFDRHGFRQSQTLSTIESFYSDGIDILHPKANYRGYPGTFVLELPIYQAMAAGLYHIFGPHIELVRLLNILFGAAATWVLYRITNRYLGARTALFASLIYWLAPLNILYQRSMLLDPFAVLCGLLSFLSLTRLLESRRNEVSPERHRMNWQVFGVFLLATWLTAMVKALYLWPSVLLLGNVVIEEKFRPNRRLIPVLGVFFVSGICFLVWNYYAGKINEQSLFTRGVKPTSHLGISVLLVPEFYFNQLIRRPKWWLGAVGSVLYPFGIYGAWKNRAEQGRSIWLLHLVAPTYLLAFADINHPHDYYQLLITPFLAITSGYGLHYVLTWLRTPSLASGTGKLAISGAVSVALLISFATYTIWFRGPHLDPGTMAFEELCHGKFPPRATGMLFVSSTKYNIPGVGSDIPEFLYAAKLWGYGHTVRTESDARSQFDELSPAFPRLDYVVFYGTACPNWLPHRFQLDVMDDTNQLYVFKKVP